MKQNEEAKKHHSDEEPTTPAVSNKRGGSTIEAASRWEGSSVFSGATRTKSVKETKSEHMFGRDIGPLEDLRGAKLNEQLVELRHTRIKLEEKKQTKSPKKKSPKKKGALKKPGEVAVTEDDATTVVTGYTAGFDALIPVKDKITVDYFPLQSKNRTFRAKTATLQLLGIGNYDEIKQVERLNPTVSQALQASKQRYGTLD